MRRDTADRPHSPPLRGPHNKTLFIFSQKFCENQNILIYSHQNHSFLYVVTCNTTESTVESDIVVKTLLMLPLFQVCRPSTCTTPTLTTTPAPAEAPSMVTRMAAPGRRTTSLTSCRWCARTAPPAPAGAPRCQWPGVITPPGCTRPLLRRP